MLCLVIGFRGDVEMIPFLMKETERDVSLKVVQNDSESFIVSGRGELHLSILIENG